MKHGMGRVDPGNLPRARGDREFRRYARLMKIAFVLRDFPVLSETFVLRQIAGLVEAGHDVRIVVGKKADKTFTHQRYEQLRLDSLVHPLRHDIGGRLSRAALLVRFVARGLLSAQGWRALSAGLRAAATGCLEALMDIAAQSRHGSIGRFDAIVAHFGPTGVRAMYLRQSGLIDGPVATVFHGFDISRVDIITKHLGNYQRLFEQTEMLLPISELWKQRLLQWGAPKDKLRVLRMGVDLDQLRMRATARQPIDPLRVLSVARLTEKKGLEYALAAVTQARSNIAYTIIGTGPLDKPLRELASAKSVAVHFAGQQPQHKVFDALEQADVFLLPSVTAADGDMEGVPVVLMEAMAKGVIVVATRHSGIPELIDDGVSGLLVAERDAAAIAHALDRVAAGEIDVARMRTEARQKVESKFDNAVLDRELIHICRSLKPQD
jgi:colanic acid/amylovoran biosynthesis glycosyltransferase